jgi:hypothetical protein
MANALRSKIPHDEFDYQTLVSALGDYRRPRDRITTLLRQGTIIRVKKGLYVFGEADARGPVCREILANLIHGPSYVSLDSALQHHGLIPERVETMTSVTVNRAREFATPVGRFTYRRIPVVAFRTGVERVSVSGGRAYLLAVPEKALSDKFYCDSPALTSQEAVGNWLTEELRIDPDGLVALDPDRLDDHARRFRSRKIRLLAALVRRCLRVEGGANRA